jgi:acetyl-CoA carboxylase carboxyl transferase subunit alpha
MAAIDTRQTLDFERPIVELENKIAELKQLGGNQLDLEIRRLERKARQLQREVFSELTPWQKVMLSRHPLRPFTLDYIERLIDGFIELHGDRAFRDDEAIVGGVGKLRLPGRAQPVMVIGHQKGRGTKENIRRNFGQPRPEGFRKARRLMELAARLRLPIVTFIDTVGAYPGIEAEERGQAEAIAKNLEVMSRLPVPIVSVVIGEGGSGGALALSVADRILMLEYAVYSVISPEGCAAILWKDGKKADLAARALRMTANEIVELGVADGVLPEPPGGAHRDPDHSARVVAEAIGQALDELGRLDVDERLEQRYRKFRKMGAFVEGGPRQ